MEEYGINTCVCKNLPVYSQLCKTKEEILMSREKEIIEWHKATFPDVDLKSQILKFLEEYREYLESGDIMELADMLIVNVVLISRFNFMGFVDIIKNEALTVYPALLKAVDLKMEINKKRKWHKVRGVYRHSEI